MSMRKYIAAMMGALVLCTACGNNSPDLERHAYTEEEKKPVGLSSDYMYLPRLETLCVLSDLIIEGVVLDGEDSINVHVQVDTVLYGETSEDIITWRTFDAAAKPMAGDQLILFLGYRENLDIYNTCSGEDSIFIKNPPDDTVFTFSSDPDISKFDGQSFKSFKKEIKKTYEALVEYLTEHPDKYVLGRGAVLDSLLAE